MKRNDWTFEYTASKLAEAAQAKRLHHETRLAWWEQKKAETIKKVGEGGIEVHDSVGSTVSNYKGGYGAEIRVDDALQRDLNECHGKIREHHAAVSAYDGWHQVLSANPEARLSLTHEDYLFFFGK